MCVPDNLFQQKRVADMYEPMSGRWAVITREGCCWWRIAGDAVAEGTYMHA